MSQENYRRVHIFNAIPIMHPVIFYDDCRGTWAYKMIGDPAGYASAYTVAFPYVGTKSLEMKTSTTDPDPGDYVEIHKNIIQPPTRLARLQLVMAQPGGGPSCLIRVSLHWYDSDRVYMAAIRFTSATELVEYADTWTPTYADSGLRYNPDDRWWCHLDVSVDLHKKTFHRLVVNGAGVDLSAIPLPSAVSSYNPALVFTLNVENAINVYTHILFDQILITPENP